MADLHTVLDLSKVGTMDLLILARKCVKEYNDRTGKQYRIKGGG